RRRLEELEPDRRPRDARVGQRGAVAAEVGPGREARELLVDERQDSPVVGVRAQEAQALVEAQQEAGRREARASERTDELDLPGRTPALEPGLLALEGDQLLCCGRHVDALAGSASERRAGARGGIRTRNLRFAKAAHYRCATLADRARAESSAARDQPCNF